MHSTSGLLYGLASVLTLTTAMTAYAATPEVQANQLLNLSLEELTNMEVTSVSKKAEKASEAPGAIYVLTNEEIRRSGATSVAEALRLVPGLNVARSGSKGWAISSRGFNDQFSNKLLVLIDGRTVYTPLFSGTYWDLQDVMLEDIDRIEVIRGPGATLWGANAVNGVINITRKKAKDTQGELVSLTAGTLERGMVEARHGGMVGDTAYRVYARALENDSFDLSNDNSANDAFRKGATGFRADTQLAEKDALTVQGDVQYNDENSTLLLPSSSAPYTSARNDTYYIGAGNILARWTRGLEGGDEVSVQAYADYLNTNSIPYDHKQQTYDIDFQHSFKLGGSQEFVWGAGYRLVSDDVGNTFFFDVTPNKKDANLFSVFVQDKITLLPNELFLTIGSKIEHNDFTGMEYQPSGRLSWLIDDKQNMWASVARAVRTPSRTVDGLRLINLYNPLVPTYVATFGDPTNESEELVAYELGYRIRPTTTLSFDVAAFYNDYDKLINTISGSVPGSLFVESGYGVAPRLILPVISDNSAQGQTWGGELTGTWDVTPSWQLSGSYSLLQADIVGSSLVTTEGKSPQHQFQARSYWNITEDWQFDTFAYYVDELNPSATSSIPDYVRLDMRLGWKPQDGVELSLVGQNLLDDSHPEFSPFTYNAQAEIPRSAYVNLRLTF